MEQSFPNLLVMPDAATIYRVFTQPLIVEPKAHPGYYAQLKAIFLRQIWILPILGKLKWKKL